jgi:hypothetical protein
MVVPRAALGLAFLLTASLTCFARPPAPPQQAPVIHSDTSLVLVDVIAQNKKTGEPIKSLQKDDFLLRDNGKPVSATSFNRGSDQKLRPVLLWFVLVCNEEVHYEVRAGRRTRGESTDKWGSNFLAGKTDDLRPVLERLNPDDTVGVAHWCDNGESEIDLPPSRDYAGALHQLDEIASRKTVVIQQLTDQDSRAQVMRLINNVSGTQFPPPFLSLVFVGGKQSPSGGVKPGEAWTGSLEISSMDLGLEGGSASTDSGGKAEYAVKSNDYASRLATFLDLLHNRYELGFLPGKQGKKPHEISMTLAKSAKESEPNALLRYRATYSDETQPETKETAKRMAEWNQLDSRMQAAVKSAPNLDKIAFLASQAPDPNASAQKFVFSVRQDVLTWKLLPNGDRRTVLTAVVATYSTKGQPNGIVVKNLEIVQELGRQPALKDKPVVFYLSSPIGKSVAKIRLLVRDVASGNIGSQDLQPVATVSQILNYLEPAGFIATNAVTTRYSCKDV